MKALLNDFDFSFDSLAPEQNFSISLHENFEPVEVDFSTNPHLILEIEELRHSPKNETAVQAGFLVNADHSCWLTNLGKSDSIEVYRPDNQKYRKLTYNQVAHLQSDDFIGFYGVFFRLEIDNQRLALIPVQPFQAKIDFHSIALPKFSVMESR